MPSEIQIRPAAAADLDTVRELWREYWDALRLPDGFQNFAAELAALPGPYQPPRGALLLAVHDGALAGTIAVRPLDEAACEAKRLYVRPAFRGLGIARTLLSEAVATARECGYRTVYGDTLLSMRTAIALYEAFGFRQVAAYATPPTPSAIYLRLDL